MQGKIVSYEKGSQDILLLEKYPEIYIKTYDQIRDALNDLQKQKVDGTLVNAIIAQNYVANLYQGEFKVIMPLEDEGLRLLTLKENFSFVNFFNPGFKKA